MKRRNKRALPTTADLLRTTRSPVALAAILRTGGGAHTDKRRAKSRRDDWRRELE